MGYTGEKKREYQRKWMRARRNEWLQKHGPCIDCESWNDLEIDHKDPSTKVTNVAWLWSYSAAKREAELEKCVVRCEQCHLRKTQKEIRIPESRRHGRYSTWQTDKCRCEPCVLAMREYKRIYRANGGVH